MFTENQNLELLSNMPMFVFDLIDEKRTQKVSLQSCYNMIAYCTGSLTVNSSDIMETISNKIKKCSFSYIDVYKTVKSSNTTKDGIQYIGPLEVSNIRKVSHNCLFMTCKASIWLNLIDLVTSNTDHYVVYNNYTKDNFSHHMFNLIYK